MKKEKLVFISLFILAGFIFLQIPVNVLEGSRVKFTLFDLFAPIAGLFLGIQLGIISVLLMQSANLLFYGFSGVQTDSFLKLVATLRFLPLIVGVWYFALRQAQALGSEAQARRGKPSLNRWILIIPVVSIVAFNLHPVGRTVWFYSLFWLIPILVWPIRERFLLARALGSTFIAHSIGGAIWIWAFNLPAAVWVSLIPIVAMERAIFALGISASFVIVNNVLVILASKKLLTWGISVNKKYVYFKLKGVR